MNLFKINTMDTSYKKYFLYLKITMSFLALLFVCITPIYIGIYVYPDMFSVCLALSIITPFCCGFVIAKVAISILEVNQNLYQDNHNLKTFLTDLNEAIIALSQGHIHTVLTQEYTGTLDNTAKAFNESLKEITQIIYAVKNIASHLSEAGHAIAEKSTDLAMRAEQQAVSLQQTTTAMEEITKTIKQNADNSQKANHLSAVSVEKAKQGNHIAGYAIESITKVENNAKRIRDIIKLIEDIAAQTNLLALNAAVEAARAGDSGRGFGVVASEVRILAQRTKDAASEINRVILNSSADIDECVTHVTQTSTALNDIVGAIHAVETIISDIAASSKQQATATAEIAKTLTHIDHTIQQTTGISDDCADSANSIKIHIDSLSKAVRFFKLPFIESQSLQDTLDSLKQEDITKYKKIVQGVQITQNNVQQNLLKQAHKHWSDF